MNERKPYHLYLGIDVSKKTCRYLILNPEGQKVNSFSLDNTQEAFQYLLQRLKTLSIPKEALLIGLEASGGFWENLYSHLKENGFSTILLNPYHANKFREALAKKIEKIVRSIKGNNFNLQEIQTLIQTAQNSIYSGPAKEDRATSLRILLRHIENLCASIEEIETEIQKLLPPQQPQDSFPGENLLTIPGKPYNPLRVYANS